MSSTNLNIRIDSLVKKQAEKIYADLGINMTTAVNIFLRACIRNNGIPFNLSLGCPNETTLAAIEEGRHIAKDPSAKGYRSMEELKSALDV
ncbi:MAG: type II toxin-antitoxin system RelB/DinJ family antitoxin [Candidatus Riflebacteria bacterium]|nr:type II toxin-antitoxin system RelB/DinJ family antitoxin [Candidatus Riflebacteria bacterium]